MSWNVVFDKGFSFWLESLPDSDRKKIFSTISLLKGYGPYLTRPYSDSIKGSPISNLKELRIQHKRNVYRILYFFNPDREAVILSWGNKKGLNESDFYGRLIRESVNKWNKL